MIIRTNPVGSLMRNRSKMQIPTGNGVRYAYANLLKVKLSYLGVCNSKQSSPKIQHSNPHAEDTVTSRSLSNQNKNLYSISGTERKKRRGGRLGFDCSK